MIPPCVRIAQERRSSLLPHINHYLYKQIGALLLTTTTIYIYAYMHIYVCVYFPSILHTHFHQEFKYCETLLNSQRLTLTLSVVYKEMYVQVWFLRSKDTQKESIIIATGLTTTILVLQSHRKKVLTQLSLYRFLSCISDSLGPCMPLPVPVCVCVVYTNSKIIYIYIIHTHTSTHTRTLTGRKEKVLVDSGIHLSLSLSCWPATQTHLFQLSPEWIFFLSALPGFIWYISGWYCCCSWVSLMRWWYSMCVCVWWSFCFHPLSPARSFLRPFLLLLRLSSYSSSLLVFD